MQTLSPPKDPAALPFLPLIYVAWVDGDLNPDEIDAVRSRIVETPSIRPDTRTALRAWLSPENPPTPRSLVALLDFIRDHASDLQEIDRESLSRLGRALPDEEPSMETVAAMEAVEEALGLSGGEAARDMLEGRTAGPEPEGASFDVTAMVRLLDGEDHEMREEMRRRLSQPPFTRRYGLSKEDKREDVLTWCRELARQGYGSLSYPDYAGGAGDMARFAVAFEMTAYFDISLTIKFGVQFGLFGGAINMLGTERHHKEYLPDAGSLELPGCFAMTENGHGSNVFDIETEARYDAQTGEFVVHTPVDRAHKEYIGNAAAHGRMAVVFAQLIVGQDRHGVHALLVPIRDEQMNPMPGVRIEDCGEKLGLQGVDNGRLWFDHVRVARENLLNNYSDVTPEGEYVSPIPSISKRFFTMLSALVAGRVSVALAGLAAMKSGLAIAVRYGESRRQFGASGEQEVRLMDYRTHQRRLLPRLATAYALDFALRYLSERFVHRGEKDSREVETLAAGLKAYATWANLDSLQECRECCGGQGYMAVNRFADLKADTDIFCTFEGDNTVLMQLVAKSLLADYRRQFEDIRPFTMLKYLGERAAEVVGEPNPVEARVTDSAHLRSREFLLGAMRYREERLTGSLARRLRSRIQGGMDSFHAFTECQNHSMAAANASVERLVLERFAAGIETLEDETLEPVLERLLALFALSRIEQDRAWFLEAGYVTTAKGRAIRAEVEALCSEVRPDALALVNGFGIPDELLGAPIAL